jgi:hypothetical protein
MPDTTLRKQASFGYSPKCLEGDFSEVGIRNPEYLGPRRGWGYAAFQWSAK